MSVGVFFPLTASARQGSSEGSEDSRERSENAYLQGLSHFQEALLKADSPEGRSEFEKALEWFRKAAAEPAPYPLALHYAGVASAKLGRFREAAPFLRQAVEALQGSATPRLGLAEARRDLGVVLYHLREYPQALEELNQAVGLEPGDARAHFYLGLSHFRLGENPAALAAFQAAVERDPELVQAAAYYSGLVQLREGRRGEALEAFRRAAEAAPESRLGESARRLADGVSALENGSGAEKRWALRFSVGGQYDSNVGILPDDPSFANMGILRQGDAALAVSAGGGFDIWNSRRGRFRAEYDFHGNIQDDVGAFNLEAHSPGLRALWRPSERVGLGVDASAPRYRLGGRDYLQRVAVQPYLRIRSGTRADTRVFYTVSDQNYRTDAFNPDRDGVLQEAGLRQDFRFGGSVVFAGYLRRWDHPQDTAAVNMFRYSGHQLEAGFRAAVGRDSTLQFRYAYRNDDYVQGRDDAGHDFRATFSKPLSRIWNLDFTYVGIIRNSNQPFYQYRRQIGSVALRLEF